MSARRRYLLSVVLVAMLAGCSGSSSGADDEGPPDDPLDQMVIAFDGSASRAEIQSAVTDALLATGEAVNDDTKSRAGSVLVTLRKEYGVPEMDMLECIPGIGEAAPNITFPDAAGLCAAELSTGG